MRMIKMMYVCLCLSGILTQLHAQTTLVGVVQKLDNQPIAYVNIGIKHKNIGTVGNENGEFSFLLKTENEQDTLLFSCVGFETLSMPIQKILHEKITVFQLHEKILALQEVVVSNQKPKLKKIGTKSINPLLWGNATSKDGKDMVEMGQLIGINKPSTVQTLHIYLRGINRDSATFRINFYAVQQGMPAERICEKNIFYHKKLDKGWLSLDLTAYDLVFEKDFIVAIELLPEKNSKGYAFAYGGQFGGSTFIRNVSLGTWNKMKGASISMYLTVKQ